MLAELLDLLIALFIPRRRLSETAIRAFYRSKEWKRLRYAALAKHGRRCLCCGASPATGARIVVDHVKPIRTHPRLRLRLSNLQVLCDHCNVGKGSHDRTDYRPSSS
jgi:5-methylcytosine-specific restriction endonuclease McrA